MGKRVFSTAETVAIPLFTALTAALGSVVLPLPLSPVPITGQTLGVMLAGSILGKKGGAVSMLLFLLLGVAGLPVFAGGTAGVGMLLGPRGGYLMSWPVVAFITGLILDRCARPRFLSYFLVNLLAGIGIVYAIGVTQLAYVTHMSWPAALMAGALPFIPGDILKAIAAALLAERLRAAAPALLRGPARQASRGGSTG